MWDQACKHIDAKYRPVPFWSWNDELVTERLIDQIRHMKASGIGGFFMHARPGLNTPYLSEAWFAAVEACVQEAERLGMRAWGYDEDGWPSGFAGGKLLGNPANFVHYLTLETRTSFDPNALSVYALHDGHLRRITDMTEEAESYCCLYDNTNPSAVDILNPEVVRQFIESTHEQYYARMPQAFGKSFLGFFTDEPQYFRYDTAYTPVMVKAYEDAYGEALLDKLGALLIDCVEAPAFRYRYWKLMNKLYCENFAGALYDWCNQHNCLLTGHTVEESWLHTQMWCCAGAMPFYEYLHIPGIDSLTRRIGTDIAPKQVGSAAMQLGREQVLTETFAGSGWDVTPAELKRIAEWQYVNGVNLMTQHFYPCSMRGARKRDYPGFFSTLNPWIRHGFAQFNEYFTTLGYLLATSKEDAPVGVVHPIRSAYLTYDRKRDADSVARLNADFLRTVEALGEWQIGHHYLDETLLEKYGHVDGKWLIMGECAYEAIVLPPMDNLSRNTADLLKAFVRNGGKLCLPGKRPTLVEGACDDLSFLTANTAMNDLPRSFARVDHSAGAVRSTCRRSEQGDYLYCVNLSETQTSEVRWHLTSRGVKRFDLERKEYVSLPYAREQDGVAVTLTLPPGESAVLVLDDAAQSAPPPRAEQMLATIPTRMTLAHMPENTLVVDSACLSYDGVSFTEPWPVEALNERLLRERTNRTIWLKYAFVTEAALPNLFVELDLPKHCVVRLNGALLRDPEPGAPEPLFSRYRLGAHVRLGANTLVVEMPYFQRASVYHTLFDLPDVTETLMNCMTYDTTIEAAHILGSFAVHSKGGYAQAEQRALLTEGPFVLQAPKETVDIARLAEEGYPFFAGDMVLTTRFDAADARDVYLHLMGRFLLAKVRLNSCDERMMLFSQACSLGADLREGMNELELTLVCANRNRFGPFHFAHEPEPYSAPEIFELPGSWTGEFSPDYRASYSIIDTGVKQIQLTQPTLDG